ncbi:MAG: diguanylate cyclase [Desulfobacterales bacterium]
MNNNHLDSNKIPNILAVDDNPQNLRLLVGILSEHGYRVRPAPSGSLALKSVASMLPDLILLDINMPEMDGYTVCEKLKADENTRSIPVIFISALNEVTDKVRAFSAGGVDFISKPFHVEEILARIRTHLKIREMQNQLEEQNLRLRQEIAERQKAEQQLRLAASVFENAVEGILITSADGTIQKVNPGFTAITGYSAEEVVGHNPRMFKSGRHEIDFYKKMWKELLEKGQWQGEIWNRRKSGEPYPEWMSIAVIRDAQGEPHHYVGLFRDITDEKQTQDQLAHQAYHDPLTGLPNRLLFNDRLGRALAYAERNGINLAVLFLDLDKFKNINDTHGHHIGDLLLQEVAVRLKKSVRNEDTVARMGGDEFTLILHDTHRGEPDACETARRILASLSAPFDLENQEIHTTPSIGIAIYPNDGKDAETLVNRADAAMYRAKHEGRGRYVCFRESEFCKPPQDSGSAP